MPSQLKIVWSVTAFKDLSEILDYISINDTIGAALKIYDKIIGRIETLITYHHRCRIIPELREIGISEFREAIEKPFRIFFKVDKNNIVLVGILDGRRDIERILLNRMLDV